MSAFFLNLGLPKMEEYARRNGFAGATWKQDVLADVAPDGALRVTRGQDPRNPEDTVWHVHGTRCVLHCVQEKSAADTLFAIGLVAAPRSSKTRNAAARVAGPWGLSTFGHRGRAVISATEHIERSVGGAPPKPALDPHHPFAKLKEADVPKREPPAPRGWRPYTVAPARTPARTVPAPEAPLPTPGLVRPRAPTTAPRAPAPGPQGAASPPPMTPPLARPLAEEGDAPAPSAPPSIEVVEAEPSTAGAGLRFDEPVTGADAPEEPSSEPHVHAPDGDVAEPSTPTAERTALAALASAGESESPEETVTVEPVPEPSGEPTNEHGEAEPHGPAPEVVSVDAQASWEGLGAELSRKAHPGTEGLLDAADPEAARLARIAAIEAQISELSARLAAIPPLSVLTDVRESMARITELGPRVSASPPAEVRASSPSALADLLTTLADEQHLALPAWVFAAPPGQELSATILGSEERQQVLRDALAWVRERFGGAPPRDLRDLPEVPGGGPDLRARLDAAWAEEQASTSMLAGLPEYGVSVVRALGREQRALAAARLKVWESLLSPSAMEDLCTNAAANGVPDPKDAQSLSAEHLEFLVDLGSFAKARKYIQANAGRTSPGPASAPMPSAGADVGIFELAHVVTDDRQYVIAATIVVPDADEGAPHVLVDVPVRLMANGPVLGEQELVFRSVAFTSLPKDLTLPGRLTLRSLPGNERELVCPVTFTEQSWREISDGRLGCEMVLSIPLRRSTARDLREHRATSLQLALLVKDGESRVQFTSFLDRAPAFSPGGTRVDDTPTSLVKNRPLGVQLQHERLEKYAREGAGAFMVVAPRRFGKTVLFQHIAATLRNDGRFVVSVPLNRDTPPAEAAREVWSAIRRACEDQLGAAPPFGDAVLDTITDAAPWRALATFLAKSGAQRMLLLVDEAQSLVPRRGGQEWGNAFKPLSESLQHGTPGAAAVQIGLFGTVDLAVRMGQNCRDALLMQGVELYEFEDGSLVRYLKTVGQGQLQSSRFARLELARWGNNLRTLIAITDRIGARLRAANRAFLLVDDVLACVDEMLHRDPRAAEEVWKYARSELSHSDTWEPVDAFPLAVAWANVPAEGTPMQRLERCRNWLEAELRFLEVPGLIPMERMEGALRDLKDRGVLRGNGSFYRPFLEGLLRVNRSIFREEREAQMALFRAAVDVVPWPDTARHRADGGQAQIYVVDDAEPIVAYRTCSLESDDKRRRFVRTCAAVRALRDQRTAPHPGDTHLPRVRSAGFREDQPSEGLLVYHWVEGEDLQSLWNTLAPAPRAHVVGQIAKAVAALHERDVVHCDICPRNIVVDGKLRATLIDFGLARLAHHPTKTRLDSDVFKAPEQSADQPSSGKPCDIYALGMLLMGPELDMEDLPEAVRELANRMVLDDPARRPEIDEVVRLLDEHLDFEPRLHELKSGIEATVRGAPSWLWEELLPFAGQIALVQGKVLPWDQQRALEVSLMLNNLFVRCVAEARGGEVQAIQALSPGKEISLNLIASLVTPSHKPLAAWARAEVKAIGLLRIALAHPSARAARINESRVALGASPSEFLDRIQDAAVKLARELDRLAGLPGRPIERLTTEFVGRGG